MAQYVLPGTAGSRSSLNLPAKARQLPDAYGTDTYQAGVPQDRESTQARAATTMSQANDAFRAAQTARLAQHAQYRTNLDAAAQQNQTRQNDLRLAQNLMIATDPGVDKSVRKFMLSGLSQAAGVDPKGEYSKNLQGMVLGMQPQSLEALRQAFGPDIAGSQPGGIQKALNGLFSGDIPIDNILQRVVDDQRVRREAADAATAPPEPPLDMASLGATPQPTGQPAGGAAKGLSALTRGPMPQTPPGSGITAMIEKASPGLRSSLADLAKLNTAQPEEIARLSHPSIDQPGAMVGGGTIEVTPGAEGEGTPPPPKPAAPSQATPIGQAPTIGDVASGMPAEADASQALAEASIPDASSEPLPEPPAPPSPSTDTGTAAAATPPPPQFGVINIPDHWRAAAEQSGDKLAQDIIAKVDQRNAVVQSYTATGQPAAAAAPAAQGAMTTEEANRSVMGGAPPGPPAPVGTEPSADAARATGTDGVSPKAEASAIAAATGPEKPAKGPSGEDLPESPEAGRAGLHRDIQESNAEARANPVKPSPDLQYVKPAERDIQDRPIPRQIQNSLTGFDPNKTYHFGDTNKIYPKLDDSKEYIKRFDDQYKATQSAGVEVLNSGLDLAKLIDANEKAGQLGGLAITYKGIGLKTDPGSINSARERMFHWWNANADDNIKTTGWERVGNEAKRFADKQTAGLNLTDEEKATAHAMLESAYYRHAFAIARANNNGGKQITDKDLDAAFKQIGSVGMTGPQNIALNRQQTDQTLRNSSQELGDIVGNPNVGINWDALTSRQRQDIIRKHTELGNKSPMSPETFKEIGQAEADYQTRRQGGQIQGDRIIQRQGNTEEHYTAAQQAEARREAAGKQQHQDIELGKYQLELQKYQDALLERARKEAQHQQDKIQAAFARIAAGLARGHAPSMPSINVGGGEQDTSAFRITPSPQRRPPAVPNIAIPQRPRLGK